MQYKFGEPIKIHQTNGGEDMCACLYRTEKRSTENKCDKFGLSKYWKTLVFVLHIVNFLCQEFSFSLKKYIISSLARRPCWSIEHCLNRTIASLNPKFICFSARMDHWKSAIPTARWILPRLVVEYRNVEVSYSVQLPPFSSIILFTNLILRFIEFNKDHKKN